MEREIYATDGVMTLFNIAEEDKENYLRLREQVLKLIDGIRTSDEVAWKLVYEYTTGNYSVFDSNSEYCGNACFHNPDAEIPEIGIELLEDKRNIGIGPRSVKLLAQTYYADKPVEYFVLKVRRKNTHSRHMMEKLGCVYVGVEENDFKERIEKIEKSLGRNLPSDFKEAFLSPCDEGEDILVYKYYPEAFLDR
ncbi:MAG: GNAT family N-acetyltransferase [Ruminococcus sp.]|nr:GNAT family N-acetyltransferase [Ruminococcus sp.]